MINIIINNICDNCVDFLIQLSVAIIIKKYFS